MSEKIYAFLLRMYPPAFRKRYADETMQLLRDRLRDEPGSFRRLRLGVELLVDIARSLPQAYRNFYTEVANSAVFVDRFDGVPSFQSLRDEPIRRGSFVLAGTLTFLVLMAFGYVMKLPAPPAMFGSKTGMSPVESVLERLNRQAPSSLAGRTSSEVPQVAQSAGGQSAQLQAATRNAAHPTANSVSSRTASTSDQARQTLEPAKLIPNARAFDPAFSGPARAPFPGAAEGRQIPREEAGATLGKSIPTMSSPSQMLAGMSEGLSGRWIEYGANGADGEFPGGLILVQRSTVLSGFGALSSGNEDPIIHGSVTGESVRFELSDGRKSFLYDLGLEGEELRGTLTIRSGNETRRATVRLRRAQ